MKLPASTTTIRNGGFEQGIMEAVQKEGKLSEADQKKLEHLQSLPQNRTEVRIPARNTIDRVPTNSEGWEGTAYQFVSTDQQSI